MQKGKKQHSTAYRALAVLLSVIILLLSLGVGATASSEEANIIYSNVTKLKKSPIPPRARATWTASSRVETATTATPGL